MDIPTILILLTIGSAAGILAGGVLAVEKKATGDRTEEPADAIAGLGEVDTGRRILLWSQHRRVRVGHGLEERQTGGDDTHPQQEGPERGDVGRRDEPESTHGDHQKAGNDAAFVAQPRGQPTGR